MKQNKVRYISLVGGRNDMYINHSMFDFNARFICNYLSKAVRPLKIIGDGMYKMISVEICSGESSWKLNDYLEVLDIHLNLSGDEQLKYNSMRILEDRYEFYLSCLQRAYEYAGQYVNVPQKELLQLHQQFREGGYKNEWIWLKKPLKEYGIYIILRCKFTTFDFTLNLEAYDIKKTSLIAEGVIFRTAPDEIYFNREFKKISFVNDMLYIFDFIGHLNFAINLNELKEGYLKVDYFGDVEKNDRENIIKRITW